MTLSERNNKLKHYIDCLKCEISGKVDKCCDDSCPIQYEAGNMGEIIENLEAISKVLEKEQEPSDKQRYVVRGINNDKMEFVDKYSVRAFNRYTEFIKQDKNVTINRIRDEIDLETREQVRHYTNTDAVIDAVLDSIDKHKGE